VQETVLALLLSTNSVLLVSSRRDCSVATTASFFLQVKPESSMLFLSGVADIFGRRFGHVKLPHNREKSYAGSIAMFLAGFIASVL
jgi:farnesol kinase